VENEMVDCKKCKNSDLKRTDGPYIFCKEAKDFMNNSIDLDCFKFEKREE
jgi:hypothetical protein